MSVVLQLQQLLLEHMNQSHTEPEMNHTGNMDEGMEMMAMSFYFGLPMSAILFKGCKPDSVLGTIGYCVAIFAVSVLYEYLKFIRTKVCCSSSRDNTRRHILDANHLTQTIMQIVQVFVSYCLMLVFMTYNGWLCLSVILGAGFGYLLFGHHSNIDADCH
ncbi:High affinity copper uptake protein 1 [Halotydeus destructor]|nr:High affinity copper uptake protein 1 [Halotydeus destructor]